MCARCGGAMEAGFAAVRLEGTTLPLTWIAGGVEWLSATRGAGVRDRERIPLVAHHCTACGNVEWTAGASSGPAHGAG
jgi:hypothetical protein